MVVFPRAFVYELCRERHSPHRIICQDVCKHSIRPYYWRLFVLAKLDLTHCGSMCKNCSNKEVLVFQFDTVMKYLESHSKQYDIDTGAFTECGIYSVYMADWQYLHYVWLPEVSTCDICLTCNGTDVVMFVQYCTAQCNCLRTWTYAWTARNVAGRGMQAVALVRVACGRQ